MVSSATLPLAAQKVDRHAAVAADGQDVQQLLQVGATGFAVAVGDRQRLLVPPPSLFGRLPVGAIDRYRGGVVVQFVQSESELPDDVPHQSQDQPRPIAVEKDAQAAARTIVIEGEKLLGREPQPLRIVTGGPLPQAVDRLPGDQQVLDEQQKSLGDGQFAAGVLAGEVGLEDFFEVHPLENAVENGQGAERGRPQALSSALGDQAGVFPLLLRRDVGMSFCHDIGLGGWRGLQNLVQRRTCLGESTFGPNYCKKEMSTEGKRQGVECGVADLRHDL